MQFTPDLNNSVLRTVIAVFIGIPYVSITILHFVDTIAFNLVSISGISCVIRCDCVGISCPCRISISGTLNYVLVHLMRLLEFKYEVDFVDIGIYPLRVFDFQRRNYLARLDFFVRFEYVMQIVFLSNRSVELILSCYALDSIAESIGNDNASDLIHACTVNGVF